MMHAAAEFLIRHGLVLLFVLVLGEQAGMPVPGAPMLLAVGSMASLGQMNFALSVGVALAGCLVGDFFWYEVGRRGSSNPLRKRMWKLRRSGNLMRSITTALKKHWLGVLLLAKFLPGPNLVSPLAGISGVTRFRFLIMDSIASIVWTGGYITVGFIFSKQLPSLTAHGSRFGVVMMLVMAPLFAAAALVRSMRRRWPQIRRWKRMKNARRLSTPVASKPLVEFGKDGIGDSQDLTAEESVAAD